MNARKEVVSPRMTDLHQRRVAFQSRAVWFSAVLLVFLMVWHISSATGGGAGPISSAVHPVSIDYPLSGTLFPRDFPPPAFRWHDVSSATRWLVTVAEPASTPFLTEQTATTSWRPQTGAWEAWKTAHQDREIRVTISGFVGSELADASTCSLGSLTVAVSHDAVEAPIFFRAVPLPFLEALRHMDQISWCVGNVASTAAPRVVLDRMAVCGNCHSFSRDGKVLGMDVDYANDKGSYVIASVAPEMELTRDRIITWSDYRRDDHVQTFGLLSQVSPDGRQVVSTVKDRSIFLPRNDLMISQIFFPFRGILAVYSRETATFTALAGADDPAFVQSSPAWSPGGTRIAFARAPVDPLFGKVMSDSSAVLSGAEGESFMAQGLRIRYDLYEIPFNGGRGGTPRPIEGASNNGASNFFPKYSPDGRWLVFTRAKSYMLLQPDSELWIVPAAGGTARRMVCNTPRLNSWHSFSPNGRWLVFASKWEGPYTQLYLSHIDENGMDTPPVWLESFSMIDRAANIPEFINTTADGVQKISERFVDENSYIRMARQFYFIFSDSELTRRELERAFHKNPQSGKSVQGPAGELVSLAEMLSTTGFASEARQILERVVEQDPSHPEGFANLGILWERAERLPEAQACFEKAVRLDPKSAQLRNYLGIVLLRQNKRAEAKKILEESKALDPTDAATLCLLGTIFREMKEYGRAEAEFREVVRVAPRDAMACLGLGRLLCEVRGAWEEGIPWVEKAYQLMPLPPSECVFLGNAYLRVGRPKDALQVFEGLERDNPGDPTLATILADLRKRLK